MTAEIARQIFKQIPMGCAYLKKVTVNISQRKEYVLADANDTFFHYLGIDRKTAINKNVSQLPDSTSDSPNWSMFFTNLDQWNHEIPLIKSMGKQTFKITASQPDDTSLFLIMDDITNIVQQNKNENKMNEILSPYSKVFFENT